MNKHTMAGCLFGMALGDALGAVTEFRDIAAIRRDFPPDGPQEPAGNPARVTDDTQMALAVGEALIAAPVPYEPDSLGAHLRQAFVGWLHNPDNTRAPGRTCIAACRGLAQGLPWRDASQITSKGCGANMRVMPVGLLRVDRVRRAAIAQLQAAYTHGHPTGLAAADLTAYVIADLAGGGAPEGLLERARGYAESQGRIYHAAWLDDLWTRFPGCATAQDFIAQGWDESLGILDLVELALHDADRLTDPCQVLGEGWVAEEAFGVALLCFLLFPEDPVAVIRRAAVTSGDSDSIACIAGAFAGACHGISAWPSDWVARIEYRDRISGLVDRLHERNTERL